MTVYELCLWHYKVAGERRRGHLDGHFCGLRGTQVLLGSARKVSCLGEAGGCICCPGELAFLQNLGSRRIQASMSPSLAWGVPGLKTAAGGTVGSLKQAGFGAISAANGDNKLSQNLGMSCGWA